MLFVLWEGYFCLTGISGVCLMSLMRWVGISDVRLSSLLCAWCICCVLGISVVVGLCEMCLIMDACAIVDNECFVITCLCLCLMDAQGVADGHRARDGMLCWEQG